MKLPVLGVVLIFAVSPLRVFGQAPLDTVLASRRIAVSAGMGVVYADVPDLVVLANATPGAMEQVQQFKSGVDFFGSVAVPLSGPWMLKVEYAYSSLDYSVSSTYSAAPADYAVTIHMPAVLAQYVLAASPFFVLKGGAGFGYHFGRLAEKFYLEDQTFTAHGVSAILEGEGNTAIGEHLFVDLQASLQYSWLGTLTNASGQGPLDINGSTSLRMFVPGVRIGVSYLM